MTIECINNESRFFQDVKTLGKRNSATLGFMPEGGFEDLGGNVSLLTLFEHHSNDIRKNRDCYAACSGE